jgi:prefoldin alpha subunit
MAKEDPKIPQKLSEQGLDELRYIQQVYQNQYAMLGNSINIIIQELGQLNSAQKTLENMDLTEGKEVITNVGSDFYLFGKIPNSKTILVGVGAGYLVEKDIDSAKTYATEIIKKRTENLNALSKSRKEVESALIEISYRIDNSR